MKQQIIAEQATPRPKTISQLQAEIQGACAGVRDAHVLALQNWQGKAAAATREKFGQFDDTALARYEAELALCIQKSQR